MKLSFPYKYLLGLALLAGCDKNPAPTGTAASPTTNAAPPTATPAPAPAPPGAQRIGNIESYLNSAAPQPPAAVLAKEAEHDLAEIQSLGLVDRAQRGTESTMDESVIRLSQKDAQKILSLLDHPPKPNNQLKDAVKTFRNEVNCNYSCQWRPFRRR